MKRILFVVAFLMMTAAFAFGQQNNAKLEVTLIQMDRAWTAAELRGDTKAAGMYVADDFWGTQPDGSLQNKTQYLADLKATKDTDVADQYVVRFFGPDLAVMTHRGTVTGEHPLQYRSTHVWVNRGGKWQIVAHHSSNIQAATTDTKAETKKEAGAKKEARAMPASSAASAATDDVPAKP